VTSRTASRSFLSARRWGCWDLLRLAEDGLLSTSPRASS
jgi:hypothetical protein